MLIEKNRKLFLFELAGILCFILPPVGIGIFLIIGWLELVKKRITMNMSVVFFMCLIGASFGAMVTMNERKFILIVFMLLGYFGVYLFVKNENVSFARLKNIMIYGSLYAIILGFFWKALLKYKIVSFFMGVLPIGSETKVIGGRLIGTAYNANFMAFFLLISFALILSNILKGLSETQTSKYFYLKQLILLSCMVGGVFWTGSRAATMTMLCVAMLCVLRWKVKTGIAFAVIILLCKNLWWDIIPRIAASEQAFGIREDIWRTSLCIWRDHFFFGTTPFGFKEAFARYAPPVPHAHNVVLAFFSEYGVIGGLAFFCVTMTIFVKLFLLALNIRNNDVVDTYYLLFPVFLLFGIFDHPLYSPQIALFAVAMLASWDKYTEQYVLSNIGWGPKQELRVYVNPTFNEKNSHGDKKLWNQ